MLASQGFYRKRLEYIETALSPHAYHQEYYDAVRRETLKLLLKAQLKEFDRS